MDGALEAEVVDGGGFGGCVVGMYTIWSKTDELLKAEEKEGTYSS